ncbi:MAG: TRAP transporter large permease subunit [Elusimicrobia bacterium]|nr:TRAP transporter large permease subunit [Elusimicrobiota bacterium]
MTGLAVTGLIVLLAAAGAPVFALLGGLSLWLFHGAGIDPAAAIIELFRLASLPALIAIPLFTFAGFLLAESKAPQRLLALAESLFGWMPGGLAVVGLFSCAVFTAFTGASGVTIIALGGLLYPMLKRQGYPDRFSLGLLTCTGSLGLLFPPSLPIILYGLVAQVSIEKLFMAGAVPGLMLLALLSVYAAASGWRAKVPRIPFSWRRVAETARAAAWEIPLPFVIVGGIYAGKFTATDSSAVMAFYVLVVEVLVYRDIGLKDLPRIVRESMVLVGAILIVLGCALGLTNYMIDAEVPDQLFHWMSHFVTSKFAFLAVLNVLLLVVNMVEIFSAIVIVVPIIIPIAARYAIDPVHLGVIFLLNLEIGYMTPPLGLNLFLSNRRFNKPLPELYRATFPFWLAHVAMLAAVTYLPAISLAALKWRTF